MNIDWSKAPDWAKVVLEDVLGGLAYAENFELAPSRRQGLSSSIDDDMGITFGPGHKWKLVASRPTHPQWNGEGPPPVGTVCLTTDKGREFEVKILAYADLLNGRQAVMVENVSPGQYNGQLNSWVAHMCEFRPIRTAEQIAADEREAGIKEIDRIATSVLHIDGPRPSATALWDAGYRKQVEP